MFFYDFTQAGHAKACHGMPWLAVASNDEPKLEDNHQRGLFGIIVEQNVKENMFR